MAAAQFWSLALLTVACWQERGCCCVGKEEAEESQLTFTGISILAALVDAVVQVRKLCA